ncbi:MAG: acyl-CoA dehydrogenase family protein, partial [Mariprofundaceae bacterium]|nr:acyl-CoA dehydrogenase family protein [Mariprofundaceae bacterium]
YLAADSNIQRVLQMYMGDAYQRRRPLLSKAAVLAATTMDDLAMASNRDENLPRLSRFNGIGERREDVLFHPAYHQLGAAIWSTGVLATLAEPGNELFSGALAYFITHNGEAGHACPVACTAGLIKLLQQVGSAAQKKRYLPRLLETDYARRLHAAQFVTEIQGGSDVAANSCIATPASERNGWYRISGEKWFCSVIDAGLFVVTARPEGGPQGTQGLALFLVPRTVDGTVNGFAIRRLKYKLGTRSLASAEVDFNGALAEPIGPLEDGFKNLMGIVLDTSRVHNALAACGLMRRACIEAQGYAQQRSAFGKAIIEHPTLAQILARMRVSACAAVAATFRILAMSDRLAGGQAPPGLKEARRIHVNINKYWNSTTSSNSRHSRNSRMRNCYNGIPITNTRRTQC